MNEEALGAVTLDVRSLEPFASFRSAVLDAIVEAASVMLSKFRQAPPSPGAWTHDGVSREVSILWNSPTQDLLMAHANEKDATEDGAYAIAIALADRLGFQVVGRVHQGSGADWLLIPKAGPENDCYKLEVSGMARIGKEKPEARLRLKLEQGRGGDYNRPGIAVVVRFEDAMLLSEAWR